MRNLTVWTGVGGGGEFGRKNRENEMDFNVFFHHTKTWWANAIIHNIVSTDEPDKLWTEIDKIWMRSGREIL